MMTLLDGRHLTRWTVRLPAHWYFFTGIEVYLIATRERRILPPF